MMRIIFTLFSMLLLSSALVAQKPTFKGKSVKANNNPALQAQFEEFGVFELDIAAFNSFVKSKDLSMEFEMEFGDLNWDIWLVPRDLRAPNYVSRVLTGDGVKVLPKGENITFKGLLNGYPGESLVAMTITDELFYGFVQMGDETYFFEPVWYFDPSVPKNQFVIYPASKVKEKKESKCGFDEMLEQMGGMPSQAEHDDHASDSFEKMGCKEVEIALASDLSMYNKYGSVGAVQAHTIGVLNNVQTNYDNEFNDELQFTIVEHFNVMPPANDPWTSSNDAGTLLNSFTSWGPTGFSQTHDVASLWTNRNFTGPTIGIAWLSSICQSTRYNCLQDFSSNAQLLRVLQAHELGHNFSATHDPSGSNTIMAPAVNSSNQWSAQSLSQINSFYPTRWCLTNCPSSQPPVAQFTVNPSSGCAPLTVQYTDQSQNNPISWNWSFPGGIPATSTQQNPVVTYNNPGSYGATLTVTNTVGTNTLTQNNIVTVETVPTPLYSWSQVGLTLVFQNQSSANATSFEWDFGDGSTSTQTNPIHTYSADGFYTVTLTATNDCGSTSLPITIPVFVAPTAGFSADPTEGCASLDVDFIDESSSNVTDWLWSFPGGSPSSSTDPNATVTYTAPGVYSVTLVVSNPAGSNTMTRTNYITVNTIPSPDFSFTVNGNTASFTNSSSNATSYEWDFGDGSTSTEENPTHTYATNGTYEVTLTATNDCGPSSVTQNVTIVVPPTAGFSANTQEGCPTLEVMFNSGNSENAVSYVWDFPGGDPANSADPNPTVNYDTPGTYDVTLIVTNSAGSDTLLMEDYITVYEVPIPGFSAAVDSFTVSFTNSSQFSNSYYWDFGDGNNSTDPNPTHTYGSDGTYTVTLTAINDCDSVTATQTVTIVTPPTAGFSANATTGCTPFTVQFNNESSENAASFEWDFPGGNPSSSTDENPTVTYEQPGTYTVTLTVTNTAGSSSVTETNYITVTTVPSAGFSASVNMDTVSFSNSSSNADSYEWSFGDGATSTEENPTHIYAEDGTYTVMLIATNDCGPDTVTQSVTIVTPPTAGFSANGTLGCAPFTVQFNNESSENAASFEWDFPGGNPSSSTEENPTVTYEQPGTYTVTLTVSNSAGSNSYTLTDYITVVTVPEAGFSASANFDTVSFTNSSAGANSYEWNFGDGTNSTEENPTHIYGADGVYTVMLIATNDCGNDTTTQLVTIVTVPTAGFSAAVTEGCAPFTVQFSNESSENATSFEWDFPGGNPASSTEENPTVTYEQAGVYTVTLTVSNAAGSNSYTITDYIVVNDVPQAGFTASTNGLEASFTNTSTNATSYEWNFGDGSSSSEENPTHTYSEDGVYEVTLTATNECGSVTTTQTVSIVTPPTAGLSAAVTEGCAPFTVQFSNESSENATSFEWEFPGGNPASSTEENPTVVYEQAGVYTVTLTVSNAAGSDTHTVIDLIVVNDVPQAGFTASTNLLEASFTNTSTNATSYEWNFGDGSSSSEENPTHTYSEDGVYEVTLTATNECGSVTTTQTVSIVTPPTAGLSAAVTEGCAPFTVQFSNESSENATSFEWEFPGGNPASSTEENPTVTYEQAGVYTVTLTVSNAAGSDSYTLTDYITVKPLPEASYTHEVMDATVNFTNTSTNATSYEWNFGDGSTSNEENPSHNYTEDGLYQVTLTATNDCGSVTTTQTIVVAFQAPVAFFDAEQTQGCAPLTVAFQNLSSENASSFEWFFQGGEPANSAEENPTVVYNQVGVYDVMLIASNANGADTFTQLAFIEVNTVPTTTWTYNDDGGTVTFTNTSTNATSYEWDFGDGTTSTEENPVHTYQQNGEYEVTLTAFNDCGFASNTITITVMVNAVEEIPGIQVFELFPNPNSGQFTLRLEGLPLDELNISLVNVIGQRLTDEKVDFSTGKLHKEFNLSELPTGTYILQLRSADKVLHKKLVIE